MKVIVNPKYEALRGWLEQLPHAFEQQGEVIYQERNQLRKMTVGGKEVCVKRFHKPHGLNRYIYRFKASKAQRSYENGLYLQAHGIGTPESIAYIEEYEYGGLGYAYAVTAQSTLTRNFYEFGDGVIAGKEDILRAFARYTAAAHEAGIYHLDYSPGNILFDSVHGEWRFEMIDINRMHIRSTVGWHKGCSNFARLWGRADLHLLIAGEYALVRGFDKERCQKIALLARKRFWRHRPHPFFVYD